MALQRLSTEEGARLLLRRLIESGRCRVEDFDKAPPGHLNPSAYRNLLRDETPASQERVEVVSPRDFGPAPNPKPSEPSEPEELDGVTIYSNSPDLFF